ncbi:hypothetical protein NUU61_005214 [Penicillium alfredii]|uniref:Beta-lactamase-related domain-containing protein n=1 Tax=Penicillium alfredii TaxID=1506179 RepID=A0A9W9F953_9EURO|nr:uncharacterized protein NUU61_005214 [Penicillium alfredii]KAJ5095858.1 hypothetical protein NUU61_005214 [Penicillium alfredii]
MADPTHVSSTLLKRLEECLPQIHQIREICQTPSITFGVVHKGKVIFKKSIGHRDAEQQLQPDADTMYMIGSCSKMFTSAAAAILVDEGKLSWRDPIQMHVPDFNPEGDPRIGREADIIDCLRHSTGLTAPSMLCIGPRKTILTGEEDLIPLLNMMPTSDEKGQRFNREWSYNNYLVGLVAQAIQNLTGQRFADFVRERILDPLGMTRTAMKRSDVENDGNVAVPCVKLSDGRFVQGPEQSWPCEEHSPLLAATGMRSSLNDMLNWCIAVLAAERSENETHAAKQPNNPLRQMARVRRGYWTRPADDPDFSKDAAYGMGWFRAELPSSMLGAMSGNSESRDKDHQLHLRYILGKDAEPFQMIGHTGGMIGSIFSVFTFPETQSAVVTMTNGRDFGDASDFTAQLLIQALFDLKPSVDLTSWAKVEAGLAARYFREKIEQPWKEGRRLSDQERDPMVYLGHYCGFKGRFTLSVAYRHGICDAKLFVLFNYREASECPLSFYRQDVYSFFEQREDIRKTRAINAADHRQMLLEFKVNERADKALGLWWKWDTDAKAAWLERVG